MPMPLRILTPWEAFLYSIAKSGLAGPAGQEGAKVIDQYYARSGIDAATFGLQLDWNKIALLAGLGALAIGGTAFYGLARRAQV